jgi:hypothetical protein
MQAYFFTRSFGAHMITMSAEGNPPVIAQSILWPGRTIRQHPVEIDAVFAQSKSNLRLIDGEELVALILQHYEQFDSRYKGLLPLKRVYVPEPLEEEVE